jgi:CRISPR-associated protein Cas1
VSGNPRGDLRVLPRFGDSWSFLYLEHCRIAVENGAVVASDDEGDTQIPVANLTLIVCGPRTSITQAAVEAIVGAGCLLAWSGWKLSRVHAFGLGETRKATNIEHQARLWADPTLHLRVARRMYERRFDEPLDPSLTLRQLRGLEGARVRELYRCESLRTRVPWRGRRYRVGEWKEADAPNRALSAANTVLYGICHSALVTAGYSPALGFIHRGYALAFVHDIADLYKGTTTVPAAFDAAATGDGDVERLARRLVRERLHREGVLGRIVDDIFQILLPEERSRAKVDFDTWLDEQDGDRG